MDIVLRAALAYGFIFFLTRIVGRRELSSLEPFDLIMLIVLGDLVQQGVTQSDYSVTGLILAGGTIALMQVAVSYLNFRVKRLQPILDGEPIVLIEDGRGRGAVGGAAGRAAPRTDRPAARAGRGGSGRGRRPRARPPRSTTCAGPSSR